ncbi:MAG: outer membrane beta-barrel protein [Bacteroidota bacterium]
MQKTKFRDLFNLHRAKVILVAFCCLYLSHTHGQSSKGNYNFLDFQQKPYYFGITLAYNNSDFRIFHSRQFILNDSISSAESVTGPGFNLGIVSNLKIGDYFDFRFLPTLSFAERNIAFASPAENRPPFTRKVESVFVELPFHLRYKSAPYNDMRMFVIAGIKYSFDVASDSRARQADELVKISPSDFAFEYGAGVQFFFPYFIFSPELKVSHGLGNILIFNRDLNESNVIEKIISRTFTISLHFEG